jgi:hypothetical protein
MSIDEIDKCIESLVGEELPDRLSAMEFLETVLGLIASEEEDLPEST